MVSSVRSLKKLLRAWYGPHKRRQYQRLSANVRFALEALEDRLAPAALSDGGTAILSISLGVGVAEGESSWTASPRSLVFNQIEVYVQTVGAESRDTAL